MANVYVERGDETTPGLVTVDNPLPVSLEKSIDTTGRILIAGELNAVTAEMVRVADANALAAGDVVAPSTTAANATIIRFPDMARYNGGGGYIVRATVITSQKANVASYRLWLFKAEPSKIADNAVMAIKLTERTSLVGYLDIGPMATEDTSSTIAIAQDGSLRFPYVCAGTDLYGILETKTAFTPDSAQSFLFTLVVDQT